MRPVLADYVTTTDQNVTLDLAPAVSPCAVPGAMGGARAEDGSVGSDDDFGAALGNGADDFDDFNDST